MTLIVARENELGVTLWSDTQITRSTSVEIQKGFRNTYGALKVAYLNPVTLVAYAGDADAAGRAIVSFIQDRKNSWDSSVVISHFKQANCESLDDSSEDNEVVFLLLLGYGPKGRIVQISRGAVTDKDGHGWIGDRDAYNKFQEAYHSSNAPLQHKGGSDIYITVNKKRVEPRAVDSKWSRADRAFQAVLDDPSIDGVGGFRIAYSWNPQRGFFLHEGVIGVSGHNVPRAELDPTVLSVGDATQGGFLVNIFGGIGVVAIYFETGRIGLLFSISESVYPSLSRDTSHAKFAELAVAAQNHFVARGKGTQDLHAEYFKNHEMD